MDNSFDVVVVGAGPAGLMAGIEACQMGASVLLLERNDQIGTPIHCAEGVTFRSIADVIDLKPQWILTAPHIGRLFSPDNKMIEVSDPDGGYVIDRALMETDLADQYVSLGGTLWVGTRALNLSGSPGEFEELLIVDADGLEQSVSGRVFIAADGVESTLARVAGIDNRLDIESTDAFLQNRMSEIEVDPNVMEVHVGMKVAPGSYAWVFPRSDHQANVGIGLLGSYEAGQRAEEYLNKFVERRFPNGKIESTSCGTAPRFDLEGQLAIDNLLVVGDAARLVDSLTGAGICFAMESGKLAGEAAAMFTRGEISSISEFHALYPGRFVEKHFRELKKLRQLKKVHAELSDDELNEIMESFSRSVASKGSSRLDLLGIVASLIKKKPRLIRLARHLI